MKYVYIDFEYHSPAEAFPELVCASWMEHDSEHGDFPIQNIWLYKDQESKTTLQELILEWDAQGYIFVAYAATAESRCFDALGLDPTEFKWIDLYLEWRQIRNGIDKYNYGTYYINNIRCESVPPHINPDRNVGKNNTQLFYGLTDCCARLLGTNIDKHLKKGMRDLILSAPDQYTDEEQADILEYCDSDIEQLSQLREMMTDILQKYTGWGTDRVEAAQLKRGEFAAHVALMEAEGIPIDMKAIRNLRKNVELAKERLISDLVEQHYPFFVRAKKRKRDLLGTWRDTYKNFATFLETDKRIDHKKWKMTDSGRYCADDEYLKKHEGIPEIKAYRETRKILGQLKWLREPKENEQDLFDAIGSDGRMRTFFGIYGTQTARNAPAAKRFIFAMSAWLRCLVRPPKGYVITEIDYASQEFAIAAILSEDKSMIEAYKSGDPYLYFAKKAGAVPPEGTKAEYKEQRDLFKATTLGLQYGMGYRALSVKLSSDLGRKVTEGEAMDLINLHKDVYPKYWRWLKRLDTEYARRRKLVLPCDWVLFGDNPQALSVRNFPTQGGGSSIIREAVRLCKWDSIKVVATLHDSVYILSKSDSVEENIFNAKSAMVGAFVKVLYGRQLKEGDLEIRLDVLSHGSDEPWISEKGARYYEILKEYLKPQENRDEKVKNLMESVYS